MVVSFLDGDIDRPVVTGVVYNGRGAADAQGNEVLGGAAGTHGSAPAGKPKKDVFDFSLQIGGDVVRAGVSAASGSLMVGGLITAAAGLGVAVAAPVLAVVVATVVVSVAVGIGLDWLDKKTGATDKLNQQIRGVARDLESRLSADYRGYAAALETAT